MKALSTFILALIWAGSAALCAKLGVRGVWAGVLGLATALVLGPAVDMAIVTLTGKGK